MHDNTLGINNYANLIQQISNLLNLTFTNIKNKYITYPQCLIEYFEKDITEKSMEIRLDREEVTVTTVFNTEGRCNSVYLFPDKSKIVEELISYLNETYDYNFITNKWIAADFNIRIRELSLFSNEVCFAFFNQV